MITRFVSLLLVSFFAMACAHTSSLTPRQQVANNVTSAFVRVHTYSTYEIYECEQAQGDCQPLGLQITTTEGMGSGGIVKHHESYSVVMTAAHVVSRFNTTPASSPTINPNVVRAFSEITSTPPKAAAFLFRTGQLRSRGIKSTVSIVASNQEEYQVEAVRCHDTLDMCFIKTVAKVDDVRPLQISENAPVIGDRIYCAQGPFGYAIPGMMVPFFEGNYSGSTPITPGTPPQDYYTFPVAPGSSGSLIVNEQGYVIGLVTSFMYGPLCTNTGCQAFSSGITVSVPYVEVQSFFNELSLVLNQDKN